MERRRTGDLDISVNIKICKNYDCGDKGLIWKAATFAHKDDTTKGLDVLNAYMAVLNVLTKSRYSWQHMGLNTWVINEF